MCAIRQAPGGGQAGRSYIAVHIDAVAGLKNSVDPQGELAGLHVVRASGFDPQIGAGRPVGGNGRPDRCQGTLRHRLAGHRWVRHFAEALCLRLSLSLDERNQLGEENRIVNAVVNPAAPQYPVLRCPYQPTVSTGERASPVGEWYLIGSGPVPGSVGYHHELDADLALRVIEPEPASLGQPRFVSRLAVPRLSRQPGHQQLQLARAHRGVVDDGHTSPDSSHPRVARGYLPT